MGLWDDGVVGRYDCLAIALYLGSGNDSVRASRYAAGSLGHAMWLNAEPLLNVIVARLWSPMRSVMELRSVNVGTFTRMLGAVADMSHRCGSMPIGCSRNIVV